MYWVLNIYTPGNRKEYKGKYLKGIIELLFNTTLDFNLADEVTVAVKKYRAKLELKFSNISIEGYPFITRFYFLVICQIVLIKKFRL